MDATGLLFTGLYWKRDRPTLTGLVGGREHGRPIEFGQAVSWDIVGPRRCVGLYDRAEHRRRPCPASAQASDSGQCELCQLADPGRLVARGQAPNGLEHAPFVLYLAWFGDGLHKVGITAEERGGERLSEQAALSYCLVAGGPFSFVRQAEMLLSGIGLAPERITSRNKQAAWWQIPPIHERAARLAALHGAAVEPLRTVPGVELREFRAVDLVPLFGLDRALPSRYDLVTAVEPGAVLSGEVSHVIGKFLVLGPTPVVVDSRLLEGWTLRRTTRPVDGLNVEAWSREANARAVQGTLF